MITISARTSGFQPTVWDKQSQAHQQSLSVVQTMMQQKQNQDLEAISGLGAIWNR